MIELHPGLDERLATGASADTLTKKRALGKRILREIFLAYSAESHRSGAEGSIEALLIVLVNAGLIA